MVQIAIVKNGLGHFMIILPEKSRSTSLTILYGPVNVHIDSHKMHELENITYQGRGKPKPSIIFNSFETAKSKLKNLISDKDYEEIRQMPSIYYAKRSSPSNLEGLIDISSDDGTERESSSEYSPTVESKTPKVARLEQTTKLSNKKESLKPASLQNDREKDVIKHIERICDANHKVAFHSIEDLELLKFVNVYNHYSDLENGENLVVVTTIDQKQNFPFLGTFLLLDESYENFVSHLDRKYHISNIKGINHHHMSTEQLKELFDPTYTKDSVRKIFKKQMDKAFNAHLF